MKKKNDNSDIIAFGGLLLPFLERKNKTVKSTTSNNALSRFDNYPTSGGSYSGGYYDKLTEQEITEQKKKDSASYLGDKTATAIYDQFYDYSTDQLGIVNGTPYEYWDTEKRCLALRCRIVPNSFWFGCENGVKEEIKHDMTRGFYTVKKTIQYQYFACFLEVFNPLSPSDTDSSYHKITIESISLDRDDALSKTGIYINGSVLPYVDNDKLFCDKGSIMDRLDYGIFKYLRDLNRKTWIDAKYESSLIPKYKDIPLAIPPRTSIYIPVILSFLPQYSGEFKKGSDYLPVAFSSSYDLNNEFPIDDFRIDVTIGVEEGSGRHINECHICRQKAAKENYKFSFERSISYSVQDEQYMRSKGYPIYDRDMFWATVFNDAKPAFKNDAGQLMTRQQYQRSYLYSFKSFLDVSGIKSAFGSLPDEYVL